MQEVVRPPRRERAVLVGHAGRDRGLLAGSMEELARLADTAGAPPVASLVQRRGTISPATFIGKGKVEEVKALVAEFKAQVAIFNDDLSPPQVRNLEKALEVRVIDRSELILDIFARRARTRESRLQVELAQLQYTLPRLTGMWTHLERQAGGIGTRGPGETQLEVDRRKVRERIAKLKLQLEAVDRERETQRSRRRREFRVAIVGYTNAGKSTLFNTLTRAGVFVEDRLFATLDATTRQMVSPERQVVLLTDTVGFIRKLPHHLVASFRSTLTEATEADILLHVVDAADAEHDRQIVAVEGVLEKLLKEPRPTLMVFNKSDRLDDEAIAALKARNSENFVVSGATGAGLDELRAHLWRAAAASTSRSSARAAGARDIQPEMP
jgi:GTP-binding protein HflX